MATKMLGRWGVGRTAGAVLARKFVGICTRRRRLRGRRKYLHDRSGCVLLLSPVLASRISFFRKAEEIKQTLAHTIKFLVIKRN